MPYAFLADMVVLLHFVFVLFVIFGGLLLLWSTRFVWLHLPMVLWGLIVEYAGWICPLTPLENILRRKGAGSFYEGGFIEHHILPLLYPEALTRHLQVLLGLALLAFNICVYAWVFYFWRKKQSRVDTQRRGGHGLL